MGVFNGYVPGPFKASKSIKFALWTQVVPVIPALAVYALYVLGLDAPPGPATTLKAFRPCVFVLAAALLLQYALFFSQSGAAFAAYEEVRALSKKMGAKPPYTYPQVKYWLGGYTPTEEQLAVNRSAANTFEQLVPFVLVLVGHALYVDANRAAAVGWAWVLLRCAYPLAFVRGAALFTTTFPAYGCVAYLGGMTVVAAARL